MLEQVAHNFGYVAIFTPGVLRTGSCLEIEDNPITLSSCLGGEWRFISLPFSLA